MRRHSNGPAQRSFDGRSRLAFACRLAWLAVIPALLMGDAAQSASVLSVGPRLPPNMGPPPSMSPPSIGPRGPVLNTVGPRFDPTFRGTPGGAGFSATGGGNDSGASSGNKYKRRHISGGGGGGTKRLMAARRAPSGVPPVNELHYLPGEVVFEAVGTPSDLQIISLFNRLRLSRLDTRRIELLDTTLYRARILDGSSVPAKIRALKAERAVRSVQPNHIFTFAQSAQAATGASAAADSAQYALAKLRLGEAHGVARGDKVLVAVIDSGIDQSHPALTGVIEKSFDALNSGEGPHSHGTAIAGIIAGHARLTGAAPAVHILAARAFSATQGSTFSILASIDWAAGQGARVINMSFAGPSDPALGRILAAARQKGVVLVAAAGNAGPKSPPLWPAADPNVIAVTATDYDDRLFAMANRGSHVAIAAPGVDILVATPGESYKMESGTSFAAAFVSGVAALVLERKPQAGPDAVKKALLSTARDLGPKGRDDQFGAGLMDAYQAVSTVDKPADAAMQVPAR
ncbi:MAG: hypothetical protein QOK01_598 [Alphaproteobacteria bacterium]|nr:hypothetical protein [Alphaproteobacteria bacterium]